MTVGEEFVYYFARIKAAVSNTLFKLPRFTCIKMQKPLVKSFTTIYQRFASDERRVLMEQKYMETLIEQVVDLLERCNDLSLIDLILKLLEKSM